MSHSYRKNASDVGSYPRSRPQYSGILRSVDELPLFNRNGNVGRAESHNLALSIENMRDVQEFVAPAYLFDNGHFPITPPKTAFRSPTATRSRTPNFGSAQGIRQYKSLQRSQSYCDLTLVQKKSGFEYEKIPSNCMEGLFLSQLNGVKVYQRIWLPEGPARCIVFISHGFGEHCGRYDSQAAAFNKRGFLVVAHDHQGHGRSGGPRGDIADYNIYVSDIRQSIRLLLNTYKGLAVYGWGHAMGACFILTIARKTTDFFDGLLLTAPLVMPDPLASTPFKKILAKHISKLNPKFSLGRIDPANLTSNSEYIKSWQDDPLVYHGDIRIHWANEMLAGAGENFKHLSDIVTPFVILQGTWDDVVVPEGAMYLYSRSKSENKQLRMFEELMHDLHNEPEEKGREVISELVSWVERTMKEIVTRTNDSSAASSIHSQACTNTNQDADKSSTTHQQQNYSNGN
eukprot:CFRG1021T1